MESKPEGACYMEGREQRGFCRRWEVVPLRLGAERHETRAPRGSVLTHSLMPLGPVRAGWLSPRAAPTWTWPSQPGAQQSGAGGAPQRPHFQTPPLDDRGPA